MDWKILAACLCSPTIIITVILVAYFRKRRRGEAKPPYIPPKDGLGFD